MKWLNNRIFSSDLQVNKRQYVVLSIYIGIVIFIVNIALINMLSINNMVAHWKSACAERITLEIPESIASSGNILKVKNLIYSLAPDIEVSILPEKDIADVVQSFTNNDEKLVDIKFPTIIEINNRHVFINVEVLKTCIKNISPIIKLYDHKMQLTPAIRVANLVRSSYLAITILVIASLLMYICIYTHQSILINSESVYILRMLSADKKYIYNQFKGPLVKYFSISFLISFFLSLCFIITVRLYYHDLVIHFLNATIISFSSPLIILVFILWSGKLATYNIIKKQTFDCF